MNWIEWFMERADRLSVECIFHMTGSCTCSVVTKKEDRLIKVGNRDYPLKYKGGVDFREFMIEHLSDVIVREISMRYLLNSVDAYSIYNRINYWLYGCFNQGRVIEGRLFNVKNGRIEL